MFFVFIEILFKMLLFKGGVLIYAEHCIYICVHDVMFFHRGLDTINRIIPPVRFSVKVTSCHVIRRLCYVAILSTQTNHCKKHTIILKEHVSNTHRESMWNLVIFSYLDYLCTQWIIYHSGHKQTLEGSIHYLCEYTCLYYLRRMLWTFIGIDSILLQQWNWLVEL